VENEITACGVLVKNMEEGWLDDAPVWTNLQSFDAKSWRDIVDIVIGGYPCQPFSNAGKRLGAEDPRHLWPDVRRIVEEVQPSMCFFENVGAHLQRGFSEVARSLQTMDYKVAAGVFTASEVGAPHKRERLFILAYSNSNQCASFLRQIIMERTVHEEKGREKTSDRPSNQCDELVYTDFSRPFRRRIAFDGSADEWLAWPPSPTDSDVWRRVLATRPDLAPATQSTVRGVANGLARGVGNEWIGIGDQLHILGNGVVPHQASYAFKILCEAMYGENYD
jgi:DNA (cytosine-5)-methyltransferase 1